MGRRVGIPQVHKCSDILGDVYIDSARRRLLRAGFQANTYSDDFRLTTMTLGEARSALERCSQEVRRLGLVLNERKTYTYTRDNYEASLGAFARAEQQLFETGTNVRLIDLGHGEYSIETDDDEDESRLNDNAGQGELDSIEVLDDQPERHANFDVDPASPEAQAARRAWALWIEEDESEDTQSRSEAAITQALLDRSLPRLGMINDDGPLENLSLLLRFEPALTPQVSAYLRQFSKHSPKSRSAIRDALDEVTTAGVLSNWQSLWLAETAGSIRKSQRSRKHYEWLQDCIASEHSGLAATAAAATVRLGIGDVERVTRLIDRVSLEWRLLAVWALARLDSNLAMATADSELERHLIQVVDQ